MAENVLPAQDVILARLKERESDDIFGFETFEYVKALDYEHAMPYLQDHVTPESWDDGRFKTYGDVMKEIHEYMDFALEKAHDERGISANRSIMHYIAWIWLAGDTELLERVQREYDMNYDAYGLPILKMIIEYYHIRVEAQS